MKNILIILALFFIFPSFSLADSESPTNTSKPSVSNKIETDQQTKTPLSVYDEPQSHPKIMTAKNFHLNGKLGFAVLPMPGASGALASLFLELETIPILKIPFSHNTDNSGNINWLIQAGGGSTLIIPVSINASQNIQKQDTVIKKGFNASPFISTLTGFRFHFRDFTASLTAGLIISRIEGGSKFITNFSVGLIEDPVHIEINVVKYYSIYIPVLSISIPLKSW